MIKIAKYAKENESTEIYMNRLDPSKYYIVFDKETNHIYHLCIHPHNNKYIKCQRIGCKLEEADDDNTFSVTEKELLSSDTLVLYCMDNIDDYLKIIEYLLKGPIMASTNGAYVIELDQGELKTCRTYTSEIEPPTEEDCKKKCTDNIVKPTLDECDFCELFDIEPRCITDTELFNMLCYYNSRVELMQKIVINNNNDYKKTILDAIIELCTVDSEVYEDIHSFLYNKKEI